MAIINLTDQFGLDISVAPSPFSVFSKYFKDLKNVPVLLKSGTAIQDVTIGAYPFKSQSLGLSFQQPVKLGTTGTELVIKPAVSGSLALKEGSDVLDSILNDFLVFSMSDR